MNPGKTIRQRVLDAALDIVEEQGVKALTQPRVAKTAGLRQSHITYYFPRKADLFIALLEASHERASMRGEGATDGEGFEGAMRFLKRLMFDPDRMRFFLRVILEAGQEPELRAILSRHAAALAKRVATQCGRPADDPAAAAFVDLVRGAGLRMLLEPDENGAESPDLEALARSVGLSPPTD